MFYVNRFAINSSLYWYREDGIKSESTRDAITVALVSYLADYVKKQENYNNPVVSIEVRENAQYGLSEPVEQVWTLSLANGAAWAFTIVCDN